MAMSSATLASELDTHTGNTNTEAAARTAWAKAFRNYFEDSFAGAVPVIKAALSTPEAAMDAGLAGMSTTGAASIQAGITAFWASMALSPVTYFAGATIIVPPAGLTSLAGLLTAQFSVNTSGALDKTTSLNNIAGIIHASNLGGTATFGVPTFPIL